MKLLVGQRKNVNVDRKIAVALVATFTSLSGPRPTRVKLDDTYCNRCGNRVEMFFSEDINTGEVYLEGPDKCAKCGQQLSDEKADVQPLSQGEIEKLFGRY